MAAKAKETVIRLLRVEDKLEDAEHLISVLRNGGVSVRPQRPNNLSELKAQLAEGHVDLVLAALDAKTLPFDQVMGAVNTSGKDISVVATTKVLEEDQIVAAA